MKEQNLNKFSFIGTAILTVIALISREITVFYMIYLFWWQALIELCAKIAWQAKNKTSLAKAVSLSYPSLFMMGLYFIFIILIFGIAFSQYDIDSYTINVNVFLFKNIPFVINIFLILLFSVLNFMTPKLNANLNETGVLSTKMITLHISIILGAVINFGINRYFSDSFDDSIYPYVFSAIPFLIIRAFFDWRQNRSIT